LNFSVINGFNGMIIKQGFSKPCFLFSRSLLKRLSTFVPAFRVLVAFAKVDNLFLRTINKGCQCQHGSKTGRKGFVLGLPVISFGPVRLQCVN